MENDPQGEGGVFAVAAGQKVTITDSTFDGAWAGKQVSGERVGFVLIYSHADDKYLVRSRVWTSTML